MAALKKEHKVAAIWYVIGVLFPPRVIMGFFGGGLSRSGQLAGAANGG